MQDTNSLSSIVIHKLRQKNTRKQRKSKIIDHTNEKQSKKERRTAKH